LYNIYHLLSTGKATDAHKSGGSALKKTKFVYVVKFDKVIKEILSKTKALVTKLKIDKSDCIIAKIGHSNIETDASMPERQVIEAMRQKLRERYITISINYTASYKQ
jgi:hypothetical protein